MNKIYLFGKVMYISKLKYTIKPKLKLYLELTIKTIDGNIFNIFAKEELLDKIRLINKGDCVYISGYGKMNNCKLNVYIVEIFKLRKANKSSKFS